MNPEDALRRLASHEGFAGPLDLEHATVEQLRAELAARGEFAEETVATLYPDSPSFHFPYPDCLGDCGDDGTYCCDGGWAAPLSGDGGAGRFCETHGFRYLGDKCPSCEVVQNVQPSFEDALRFICTTNDSGPWIEVYRSAGGGYEGLQAVAAAALESRCASPTSAERGHALSAKDNPPATDDGSGDADPTDKQPGKPFVEPGIGTTSDSEVEA